MRQQMKCKFCGVMRTVEVDDSYVGDVFKLSQLFSCDRCGDYRISRQYVSDKIKKVCMRLLAGQVAKDDLPKTREILMTLVQRYMRLMADYRDAQMPDWDNVLLDDMMAHPGNFSIVLSRISTVFNQPTLV
jgi:hypothetical protein